MTTRSMIRTLFLLGLVGVLALPVIADGPPPTPQPPKNVTNNGVIVPTREPGQPLRISGQVFAPLVPVRQLLSKSWLSRSNQLEVADHESSPVADSLWLFGFKWKQHAARFLQVTDVLQGSPADRAGLTIGDRIVGLNSTEIYRMGAVAVESLLTVKYPTHLRLTILQSGSPREVELSSVGVSWILRAAATSKRRERPNVVVASTDF